MTSKRRTARRAAATVLHTGCNSIDSIRIMTFAHVLRGSNGEGNLADSPLRGALSEREYDILMKRVARIRQDTDYVRKLARYLEKRR